MFIYQQVQTAIMDIVRYTLSPELLNRIDETILFNRLQREHIDAITSKFLFKFTSIVRNKSLS